MAQTWATLYVRIPAQLKRRLEETAAISGTPQVQLVIKALEEYLDKTT